MKLQKQGTQIINHVRSELMYYCTVEVDGEVVHETGRFKTRELARQNAQEWESGRLKKQEESCSRH